MTTVGVRWSLPVAFDGVREIGTGSGGVVVEAVQRSTGRPVAVKLLTVPVDDADRRRFARECAAMAALASHPHIVTILDAGIHEGRPWIAMELCRRGSLAGAGVLDVPAALDVLIAVADAVDAAHRQDVLHCDLKPANILTTDYGAPAVGDFGIARPASYAATSAAGGYSLDHAAPEVLDGRQPTAATDVYCLGTTVWTLLSGRPPFRDDATTPAAAVVKRILLDPLPALPSAVPADLAALLVAMTAKAPTDRVGGMAEVARRAREIRRTLPDPDRGSTSPPLPRPRAALETDEAELTVLRPLRGGHLAAPATPAPSGPPPTAWPTRGLLALTGVILVGLLVAGTVAAVRGGPAPPAAVPATVAPSTPTALAPPSGVPTAIAVDDLGLDVPERPLECDGSFIVIVGSAAMPGRYPTDVAAMLDAAPGSHYLLTAHSCRSFVDRTPAGDPIYAIYLGPFPTLDDACVARAEADQAGSVVRQLVETPPTAFPTC